MKKENFFYSLILGTILTTRISIIIVPNVEISFLSVAIHHFWFGIVLLLLGFILPKKNKFVQAVCYGVGTGLVIDQLIFMLLGGGGDAEYWAWPSVLGMLIFVLVSYQVRKILFQFYFTINSTCKGR